MSRENSTIRIKNTALLSFGLLILFLAGAYFGGHLMTLFFFFLCLPLISVLMGLISLAELKYHQEFDTEHPIKGQDINYRLILTNESILPIARIHCRFKAIHPQMNLIIPDFSIYLKARGERSESHTFRCSYRGIYTVGLERIEITDPFGILTVAPQVLYRTFYVYPRIPKINHLSLELQNWEGSSSGISHGGEPDYSLYTQLKSYLPGESMRHIHWKKFATTGKPFLRQYETTSAPEIGLYLDTRPCPGEKMKVLEIEDTSVEILVALVKYFLDNRIPLSVSAPGREIFRFSGSSPDQFESFYHSTINLTFRSNVSPAQLYSSEVKSSFTGNRTLFFITHVMDPALFGLVEDSLLTETPFILIFNQAGYSEEQWRQNLSIFNRLREKGVKILIVNNSESIVSDLGR